MDVVQILGETSNWNRDKAAAQDNPLYGYQVDLRNYKGKANNFTSSEISVLFTDEDDMEILFYESIEFGRISGEPNKWNR